MIQLLFEDNISSDFVSPGPGTQPGSKCLMNKERMKNGSHVYDFPVSVIVSDIIPMNVITWSFTNNALWYRNSRRLREIPRRN